MLPRQDGRQNKMNPLKMKWLLDGYKCATKSQTMKDVASWHHDACQPESAAFGHVVCRNLQL